jgi:hypothetical protein
MTPTRNLTSDEHLVQACDLLDKSKEQAGQKRFEAAALTASWAQVHAQLADALILKHRRS